MAKAATGEGRSLGPAFKTGEVALQEWMFWEHVNDCAVRHGKWKALQDLGETEGQWELYDLEADRCETNDLAAERPEIVEKLAEAWYAWAWRARVLPKGKRS